MKTRVRQPSTFRQRLDSAAARLEALAVRSSPMIAGFIRLEAVAVREASRQLEDEPCHICGGGGSTHRGKCVQCDGSGAL